jgi:DNA invertase Pin-like site-specific DNA recombinase
MQKHFSFNDFQSPDQVLDYLSGILQEGAKPNKVKRVVLYIRKSRIVKKGEVEQPHYSPIVQASTMLKIAKQNGWEVVDAIYDLNRSGKNAKREGFQKMLDLVDAGLVDAVFCQYLNRTYRNGYTFPIFLNYLEERNVELISATENLDSRTLMGRMMLSMRAIVDEMPVWEASDRVRGVKAYFAANGHSNATSRFGYCNGLCTHCTDSNGPDYCPLVGGPDRAKYDGKILIPVPHPIESHAVRLVAHEYPNINSDQGLADLLNDNFFVLPDGQKVRFRTKTWKKSSTLGEFKKDSIREIIKSEYYIGVVTHQETPPLNMKDDLRDTAKIVTKQHRRNAPKQRYPGKHEPLYPRALWERNTQLRMAKGNVSSNSNRQGTKAMLSGLAKCWECYQDGLLRSNSKLVSLRGTTNGSGKVVYRCLTILESHSTKNFEPAALHETGIQLAGKTDFPNLIKQHQKRTLEGAPLLEQVEQLLEKLIIPVEWHERILAFYLSDEGLNEFDRLGRNLSAELEDCRAMYRRHVMDEAEFDQHYRRISAQMNMLRPSADPQARAILPRLDNFKALWDEMSHAGRRALLEDIFVDIFFDSQERLRGYRLHEPFKPLFGVVKGLCMID